MAKRFHFRLQPLLRAREIRAQECERALAEILTRIADLDELDREADVEIAQQRDFAATIAGAVLSPVDMIRRRAWVGHLQRLKMERAQMRQDLQAKAARAREKYISARRATRVLEKLRERGLEEYRHALRRREQARMDEVAQQLQFVQPFAEEDASTAEGVGEIR
ncbi:MAG: flagellar export protein FliJ [Phycisphaerae bacterium]